MLFFLCVSQIFLHFVLGSGKQRGILSPIPIDNGIGKRLGHHGAAVAETKGFIRNTKKSQDEKQDDPRRHRMFDRRQLMGKRIVKRRFFRQIPTDLFLQNEQKNNIGKTENRRNDDGYI